MDYPQWQRSVQVDPWGFFERGQTKDLKDLVKTGRDTQSFLDNGDKNVGCANDPDLQLGRNLRRSEERVDSTETA